MRPVCEEWAAAQSSAKAKDRWSIWRNRRSSALCDDQAAEIKALAEKNLEALKTAEISGSGSYFRFSKPYLENASVEWFDDQLAKTKHEIAEMKAAIAN